MEQSRPLDESIFPEREIVYATFMQRFLASVVDGVFVFLAWFIVAHFTGGSAFGGFINLLILLLYFPLMEGRGRQAPLGKTGMNIKVTDMEGDRINMGQAFGRHLGRVLSMAVFFAGYFMMLWSHRKQTLHDRMAATQVIMVK